MDIRSLHELSGLGCLFCISSCTYCCPGRYKVTFVKNKNEVFPGFFLFQVSLNVRGTGTHWVSSIKNLNYNIWRIYHLQIQRGKSDLLLYKGKMNEGWHLRQSRGKKTIVITSKQSYEESRLQPTSMPSDQNSKVFSCCAMWTLSNFK